MLCYLTEPTGDYTKAIWGGQMNISKQSAFNTGNLRTQSLQLLIDPLITAIDLLYVMNRTLPPRT
jgi:hypothetical protein